MAYFYDQHLAWQQRVTKELSAASRFLNEHATTFRPPSKSSIDSHISTRDSFLQNRPDLRTTNVFAEVRGKYARQAFHQLKKPEQYRLSNTENPLLARPTTSGSLVARNMVPVNVSHKRSQSHLEDVQKVEEKQGKKKSFAFRSISSKAGKSIVSGESFMEEDLKIHERIGRSNEKGLRKEGELKGREFEKEEKEQGMEGNEGNEGNDEELIKETDADEYLDQVNELENDLKDLENLENLEDEKSSQGSKQSQYSSASQKRIMELEALLKEERLKRYELEKSIKNKK